VIAQDPHRFARCEAYLHIAQAKTAELVSACCLTGAVLGGASEAGIAALAGYGRSLGLLFQIADDLADGDCPCSDRSALVLNAEDCRGSAAVFLEGLPENDALAMLRGLPAHIFSPSPR
jgi:hypothetical protein